MPHRNIKETSDKLENDLNLQNNKFRRNNSTNTIKQIQGLSHETIYDEKNNISWKIYDVDVFN